jgi:fatty acid desaturase
MYASLQELLADPGLAVPTAFLLIRLFIIQHDAGTARSSLGRAAESLGRSSVCLPDAVSLLAKSHAIHHATNGNLERRGFGDIKTLTVDEYPRSALAAVLVPRTATPPYCSASGRSCSSS